MDLKKGKKPVLPPLSVPAAPSSPYSLSDSGTFGEAGFKVNRNGIVESPTMTSSRSRDDPSWIDLEDLEKQEVIGRGAGGIVHKAVHRKSGRVIALKTLNLFEESGKHEEVGLALRAAGTVVAAGTPDGIDRKRAARVRPAGRARRGSKGSRCVRVGGSHPRRANLGGPRARGVLRTAFCQLFALALTRGTLSCAAQVINELQTLYGHECPEIISFHGAFYSEGSFLMALEYMENGSLADVLKRCERIPEAALGKIAVQAVRGLVELHKVCHIMHRDLKPANILINRDGVAKLADFGAKRDLDSTLANAKTFVGTATYMSPERVAGGAYTSNSDVWSLGVTLIECATGSYPYPLPKSYLELHQNIMSLDAPELPEDGNFSPEFRDFVNRCLIKDPDQRATSSDLLTDSFITTHVQSEFDMRAWIKSTRSAAFTIE